MCDFLTRQATTSKHLTQEGQSLYWRFKMLLYKLQKHIEGNVCCCKTWQELVSFLEIQLDRAKDKAAKAKKKKDETF